MPTNVYTQKGPYIHNKSTKSYTHITFSPSRSLLHQNFPLPSQIPPTQKSQLHSQQSPHTHKVPTSHNFPYTQNPPPPPHSQQMPLKIQKLSINHPTPANPPCTQKSHLNPQISYAPPPLQPQYPPPPNCNTVGPPPPRPPHLPT